MKKTNNEFNGKPRDHFIYVAESGLNVDDLRTFLLEQDMWTKSLLAQGTKSDARRSDECHILDESWLTDIRSCVINHLRSYLRPYKAFCEVSVDEGWRCLRYTKKGQYKPHSDGDTGSLNRRVSALIYLNDGYDGGELHFPFQDVTIQPKKGQIVLFPSGFTHVHTSKPVKKGEKFVIVSWLK